MDSNTGERKHSSKGLAMPIDQVDTLLAAMPDIQAAVDGGTDLSINLLANGLCVVEKRCWLFCMAEGTTPLLYVLLHRVCGCTPMMKDIDFQCKF